MIDFEDYAKQGSNYKYVHDEFLKLKEFLDKFKSSEGRYVEIFLQGSYKNDTNIGKESDIDIVVYYPHVFYSNVRNREDEQKITLNSNLSAWDIQNYNNTFSTAEYGLDQFKFELMEYLKKSKYIISLGNKTIKCRIPNSKFTFDIICAFQYRFYKEFINRNTYYTEGNSISEQNGNRIINFPKQSYKNSVNKNKNECDGRYKETIRIFKNIMAHDINENIQIPSFALESILYNVNSKYFTETDKKKRCLSVIKESYNLVLNFWNNLVEPNQLLFVKDMQYLTQLRALVLVLNIWSLIDEDVDFDRAKREFQNRFANI